MDKIDRINLQKMIASNDVKNNTEDIKQKKHSGVIRQEVTKLVDLKKKYSRLSKTNSNEYVQILKSQCSFLYNNYTDIFNRIKNDELDLEIFSKFLNALKSIEDGECDQHEASYNIGSLLKTMYIDSAVRHANKIENKKQKHGKEAPEKTGKNITWANFKKELK